LQAVTAPPTSADDTVAKVGVLEPVEIFPLHASARSAPAPSAHTLPTPKLTRFMNPPPTRVVVLKLSWR
jgi:hypothetical protein